MIWVFQGLKKSSKYFFKIKGPTLIRISEKRKVIIAARALFFVRIIDKRRAIKKVKTNQAKAI